MTRLALVGAMSCVLLLLLAAGAPETATRWKVVGPENQVRIEGGSIRLFAGADSVVGAVSDPIHVAGDVLLISAQVSDADARAVTFCLNDSESMPVGYWQNPLPIKTTTQITCALDSESGPGFRLFVGSDRIASGASVENIQWRSARRTFDYSSAIYGAIADNECQPSQSIIARGSRLVGISTRLRMLSHGQTGPDLLVRVLPASGTPTVLDEVRIPRYQIPTADTHEPREITIALDAPLERGKTYLIEFAVADACPEGQGVLLYAGRDDSLEERLHRNRQPVDPWDLYLKVYESDE